MKNKNIPKSNFFSLHLSSASIFENSDIIILCASYSESNIGMINESMLGLMKGKYFVNIAQGALGVFEDSIEKKVLQRLTQFTLNRSF